MPLLNYTTAVSVDRTIQEITRKLVDHGAKRIVTEYAEGQAIGLSFLLRTDFAEMTPFSLPCHAEKVHVVLRGSKVAPKYRTPEHAGKVAWRILKDWIEAQLAIVETEMVTLDQVMLPYLVVDDGRSLYENVLDKGLAMLGSGR